MKKIHLALPLLCSLPVLHACVTAQPQQQAWGVQPIYNVQHSGGNARDFYQLGRYLQGQNRHDQAIDAYKKALTIDANYMEAHNALGAIYSTQGKFEEALVEFNTVIERSPQTAHLYNNLGFTYYLQNKFPEAIESFNKAVVLDPRNERALNNLALAYSQNGETDKASATLARVEALKGSVPAPQIAAAKTDASALVVSTQTLTAPIAAAAIPAAPAVVAAAILQLPQSQEMKTATPLMVAAMPIVQTPTTSVAANSLAPLPQRSNAPAGPSVAAAVVAALPDNEVKASAQIALTKPVPALVTTVVAPSGVVAEMLTEFESVPVDRNVIALASANMASETPTLSASKLAILTESKTFKEITDAALRELTPNIVALKAAKDKLVANIFRITLESAFNDLTNSKPFRLEVANGNGISGLAKKVSDVLTGSGLNVQQVTNVKNYNQRQTVIQYRNGYQVQAATLSKGMRNKPQMFETNNLKSTTDVRLVLGRDVSSQVALFETESDNVKLASNSSQDTSHN